MGPLTDSEKQLIIQMENSGSLLKDIAATLHRNPITVRSYLTSQGYEPTNKKYSSEEKEQIRDVEAFYHYLYDDVTIYLTRKKARFEKLPYCVPK